LTLQTLPSLVTFSLLFYFFPIGLASWRIGPKSSYVVGLLCALAWLIADQHSGRVYQLNPATKVAAIPTEMTQTIVVAFSPFLSSIVFPPFLQVDPSF
jgi:hypothetical protein